MRTCFGLTNAEIESASISIQVLQRLERCDICLLRECSVIGFVQKIAALVDYRVTKADHFCLLWEHSLRKTTAFI